MRLIVNFNRHAFEAFGFDRYGRAEIDANGPDQIMMCLSEDGDGMAFSPCNDGNNASEGEKERYKIRVPSEIAEQSGLVGSSRYSVVDSIGNPGFFDLKLHSYIVAGQPESFPDPVASVSYTEVDGKSKKEREENYENAAFTVLAGGDAAVIMNTLRMSILGQYGRDACWLKNSANPSVCHIRHWNTGEDTPAQHDLLLDLDNVILLSPNLKVKFINGDFTIGDDGTLIFADGIDPVEDCGFNQRVIDMGRNPKIMSHYSLSDAMRGYFKWHRENIFRK